MSSDPSLWWRRAFIAPFSDPKRFQLYLGTFAGVLGFDLVLLMFSYKFAAQDAASLIGFWGIYFLCSSLVMFPALCAFYCRRGAKAARIMFVVFLVLGLGLFKIGAGNIALMAVANSFISIPFWVVYHIAFAALSSDENRGHEIAVAYIMIALGGAAGYLTGGYVLGEDAGFAHLAAGFGATVIGTLSLLSLLPEPDKGAPFWRPLKESLLTHGPARTATVISGANGTIAGFLLPTYLAQAGLSGPAAGVTMALRIATGTLVTPLAGRLIARANHHELRLGMGLYGLAWVALLLPVPFAMKLMAALILWAAAGQLYNSGMDSGWYSQRKVHAVAAREMLMNTGRLLLLLAAAPWVFASPETYPLFAVVYSAAAGLLLWSVTKKREAKAA